MKSRKIITGVILVFVMLAAFGIKAVKASNDSEVTVSSNQTMVTLIKGNSWEVNGASYQQVDASIKNTNSKEVNSWKIQIPIGKDTVVSQNWNCQYESEASSLTIEPVDYNSNIREGETQTFGFIVENGDSIDWSKATVVVNNQSNDNDDENKKNDGQDLEDDSDKDTEDNKDTDNNKDKDSDNKENNTNIPDATTDDWLYTDGSKILDKDGKEVWLTGVNWFGYNTGTNTFDGLWSCKLEDTLEEIANRGFNLLRVPISSELILQWKSGEYPKANYNDYVNKDLNEMNSLQIFDYVVGLCRKNGIKIMIDIHSVETNAMGHLAPLWYNEKFSEKDYLDSLQWMAQRYAKDDTILAYDLKNEPHGKPQEGTMAIWNDSTDANNWKYVAEKAAAVIFEKNPNVLVMVEGIEAYPTDIKTNGSFASKNPKDYFFNWWGGNLRGVKDFPVNLGKYQNKLVYSPHDYGPTVYEQSWFEGDYTMESLYQNCWKENWMYIQEEEIAPLLIGEWGGYMTSPNIKWMTYLRDFIKKNRINHTFWCFNANSGDTGGLVQSDFGSWDEEKYAFVKEVLWQSNGKFVGLDHKIPLGKNGITLSEYTK